MVKGVDEEAAALGAILLQGGLFDKAVDELNESDFYKQEHRLMWRSMNRLAHQDISIDMLSVKSDLEDHKELTQAGGASFISRLTDALPDIANFGMYVQSVKNASTSRKLYSVGTRLQDHSVKPAQRIDIAFATLSDITRTAVPSSEARVGDVVSDIYANVLNCNGSTRGIMTGFEEIDNALDGINRDELIILGARPSIGKSAFSLQVAWNIARSGKRVFYVSPEMSQTQLAMRLMSIESGVPYMAIKRGRLPDGGMERVRDARDRIITLPLDIDDSSDQDIESVRMKARKMKSNDRLDLLMVDYLQLLCKGDDSKEAVTIVSKGLKAIAKDLSIPVWAVTQLSRTIEYRDDKRPRLSDIRGSGQVEQDADVVSFIWQPTKTKHEVFIEKNRNGPLASTYLRFDKSTTKFTPIGGK